MKADGRLFLKVTLPLAALNLINQASRTIMAIIGPVPAVEFSLSASELVGPLHGGTAERFHD